MEQQTVEKKKGNGNLAHVICLFLGHKPVGDKFVHLTSFSSCEAHCKRCGVKMFGTNGLGKYKQWVYTTMP